MRAYSRERFTKLFMLVVLAMVAWLAGCGSSSGAESASEAADTTAETPLQDDAPEGLVGTWYVGQQTDDFGDIVENGDEYLYQYFTGEFSNTATSGSELTGMVLVKYDTYLQDYAVMFSLHEYNNASATYTSSDSITLKTKNSAGVVRDYALTGTPPNGYVGTLGTQFLEDLHEEPDAIRCIIEIGSSRYEFSVSKDGLDDIISQYVERLNGKMDKVIIENSEQAISNIMPGNDPNAQRHAAQVLSSLITSFEQLDQQEVGALFPGTYAWIDFAAFCADVGSSRQKGYMEIYRYEEKELNTIGRVNQTGEYYDYTLPEDVEWRLGDGAVWLPHQGDQVVRIADGYYLVWREGKYYAENGQSSGLVSGGLMFACDGKGNPTKPFSK